MQLNIKINSDYQVLSFKGGILVLRRRQPTSTWNLIINQMKSRVSSCSIVTIHLNLEELTIGPNGPTIVILVSLNNCMLVYKSIASVGCVRRSRNDNVNIRRCCLCAKL